MAASQYGSYAEVLLIVSKSVKCPTGDRAYEHPLAQPPLSRRHRYESVAILEARPSAGSPPTSHCGRAGCSHSRFQSRLLFALPVQPRIRACFWCTAPDRRRTPPLCPSLLSRLKIHKAGARQIIKSLTEHCERNFGFRSSGSVTGKPHLTACCSDRGRHVDRSIGRQSCDLGTQGYALWRKIIDLKTDRLTPIPANSC
jgi:hypothetical protein